MRYDIQAIRLRHDLGEKMKFIFFWGHKPMSGGSVGKTCLSQWYDCRFTVDGTEFHTAEQYMMAQKALLFGDKKIYAEIMAASDPGAYKDLGRRISGFDEKVWEQHRTEIVIAGNMAKFGQNEELRDYLLATEKSVLVEASPYDRIWGIGLSADTEGIEDPYIWKGSDLLGFCLMEVRDRLKEDPDAR
ncbi:MAG: NADAR family protein [Ruminococcus sp.]|nr:NADAR family protein [Ruminococcus sp.]